MALGLASCGSNEIDNYPWNEPRKENVQTDIDSTSGKGKDDPEAMANELKGAMQFMIRTQEHAYQYQRANHIDVYAGYWTVTQNKFLFGGALPTTYTFPNDYLMGAIGVPRELARRVRNAYEYAEALNVRYRRGIAIIMFDFVMQELTDIYGPIAFDDIRNDKKLPPFTYISQEEVYRRIFGELDEAIAILKEERPEADELKKIEGALGGMSRGDWRNWVKLANSLRLRMAMNIVKIAPELAQIQAEKAMSDEIGVFTDRDAFDFTQDRVFCDWVGNNPLWQISYGWDDLRLGASLENIMKRYQNPMIGKWFTTHGNIVDPTGASTGYMAEERNYMGVRQGIAMIDKSTKTRGYGPFSQAGSDMQNMPTPIIKRTEMMFAMAEASLRGWSVPGGASAEELYERGIRLSFAEHGFSSEVDAYLAQTTVAKTDAGEDIDYVDPYNTVNSLKGRVTVGVAWNENDTDEVKLEKIITQKYIAVFPSSLTTWTTFRRTGYPRLFPVYINNWPGVDGELQLRRIPYVLDVNNAQELATIPGLLGGPNEGGTRLWWDVATDIVTDEPGDDLARSKKRIPKNF